MRHFLEISNLSFSADKEILKSLNWQAQKGQRWVILGANGAGKSSLIATIFGINSPALGSSIRIGSKTFGKTNWIEVKKSISLIGSQLVRNIKGDELVVETVLSGESAMINYWGNYEKDKLHKVKAILTELGIEHLAFSTWSKISQGERQKVLVARSFMAKPKIMFLDEPCSALDPVARVNFLEFLDTLCANKKIPLIVMTTHHIEEISPAFTHALVIKNGEVLAQGKIEDIVNSKILSQAYNAKCKVTKSKNSYSLKVL
ncbi:MAG: ATP-binding cassette domain-containing protein [Opitutales bacterium]